MSKAVRFLIIGNGRVAKHFAFYFDQLNIVYQQWHRHSSRSFSEAVSWSTHVLLLLSDKAISAFVADHQVLNNKVLVHFSGSLVLDNVLAAHPLMTFSDVLYTPEFYPSIPFILHQETCQFDDCLPGLPNPHYFIPQKDVPYYHSLCVMANNYTTLLWNKCFSEFSQRWNLPREVLLPIMQQTVKNIECLSSAALTGPLARGDTQTVQHNLNALQGDVYQQVYHALVNAFLEQKRESNEYNEFYSSCETT